VVTRATGMGVALVWSVDFFRAFCRVLTGEITGNAVLDRITGGAGVVDFTDLLDDQRRSPSKIPKGHKRERPPLT
jgi:hypothetical protein